MGIMQISKCGQNADQLVKNALIYHAGKRSLWGSILIPHRSGTMQRPTWLGLGLR